MKAILCLISTILSVISIMGAAIYPINPSGETVWKVGSSVKIEWNANDTPPHLEELKPFSADLCTGMDQTQPKLDDIATRVPAETTSIEYIVPNVSPYGRLYFLRFTILNLTDSESSLYYWATRFTITNNTTPPPSTATGSLVSTTSTVEPISQSSELTTESETLQPLIAPSPAKPGQPAVPTRPKSYLLQYPLYLLIILHCRLFPLKIPLQLHLP